MRTQIRKIGEAEARRIDEAHAHHMKAQLFFESCGYEPEQAARLAIETEPGSPLMEAWKADLAGN